MGVTIHSNLNFSKPVTYLCATDNRKLHTLSHVSKYILMKSCIISQSSYCPLIWMTLGRGFNNVINHTHERALRIVYKDFSVSFEGLLAKDTSVTIRNRNLQQLVIEFFKVKMKIFPILMKDFSALVTTAVIT